MKLPFPNKPLSAFMTLTLACALSLGSQHAVAVTIPSMTIKIFNNDPDHNIYPVLTTGTSTSNLWLRAWFGITKEEADKAEKAGKPYYPKEHNFRIYINPTGTGIPPRKVAIVKLPFITQLVPTNLVDPKQNDQYADWWGGGRIELFAAPVKDGAPPPELTALYTGKPGQTKIDIATLPKGSRAPVCTTGCAQPLELFKDTLGVFKNNAPSQLTEYTLGVINQDNNPPTLGTYFGAVDIDVSYVDTVYLPAAMAPFNPREPKVNQVGYVGTPLPIGAFRDALNKFIGTEQPSPYAGWPQFLSETTKEPILKLASTMHATAGDPDLTPPNTWAPINELTSHWKYCLPETNKAQICQDIRTVRQFFSANYVNYTKIFPTASSCDQKKGPVQLTEALMIAHVYGFTPFGENCSDAKVNLLEQTPNYVGNKFRMVKDTYDGLQYWPNGSFNPYVVLIHGEDAGPDKIGTGFINAPNVYAYSVDDAVGNLQADGNGFVIAVGGTKGLPKPKPASPPVNINFGGKSAFGEWTHFGICTTDIGKIKERPINPDHRSIAFYVQKEDLANCPISLLAKWAPGGQEVVYSFKLKGLDFIYGDNKLSPDTHAPIDCSGLGEIQKRLCQDIFAYAVKNVTKGPDTRNVIVPGLYPH